ncbi:hypothetical protein [Streptomyces sp. NPDC059063]|uniref:hypothetical protein n=1 Tax=unclassified Streptomyces TaxID=2593676 RepID=UPI0036A3A33B
MAEQERRPDSADLAVIGCGWVLIVAVVSVPGLVVDDGPLIAYMAGLGAVIASLWARKRLRRRG